MNPITIPMDIVMDEILTRLPAKSVARFRCVSKQWASVHVHNRLRFNELFLNHSSTRPRLLFALERANDELLIFSSPQPWNQYGGKSSLAAVQAAHFHMKFPWSGVGFTSGLIYFSHTAPAMYNPITGVYASLPRTKRYRKFFFFLGFDPIDKQYKAVFMAYPGCMDINKILTIGSGKMKWRWMKCQFKVLPLCDGICINGVLYYIADSETVDGDRYVIVCLDVRTEKLRAIDADFFSDPHATTLINYKGKLGGIDWKYDDNDAIELCLYVLEDIGEQEWSKYVYTLPESKVVILRNVFVVGVTAIGEIVLSEKFTSKPFYVFYFSPERNTLLTVEIEGVGEHSEAFETDCKVYAYLDYVEDFSLQRV